MKPIVGWTLAVAALLGMTPFASQAQPRGHDRGWHGDIRHFERNDLHHWRSGTWRHGWHRGQMGWWWVVGGVWYFHSQPVYPYPDPYRPPIVVEQAPPVIIQMPAPAVVPVEPAVPPVASQPSAQFWYYCDAARGYYPYVASCPGGWKTVPATPPGAPQ